ncbi:SusC/RagA family TonB-linked outer membrane protein [Mucilaginibacter ginkgonis]|uniref:SusC/RagA family TonB-linked outer membrane protein n=1 Tax=Mucilaginibacter ginkgonis TaxID=2682091 RepID=A0A6I4I0G5_9SPHI|nr:SusC/RagA family TonB-linked outer membrane protein [Mucilaginibacter ginkgonis]QQL49010.1 SusC/RagA family TonB-linked outer membrane protein [Mucilaginibacter ginkgonis]
MKKHLLFSLCVLLLAFSQQLYAQNRTVTGTVTGKDDGLPLPGVSVVVPGSTIGTQTDAQGKYTLRVPAGTTALRFSFIGYGTEERAIPAGALNVALTISARQLGEVVVQGALGLNRNRNQQSYAAQTVSGESLSATRSTNISSELSGKVAGLEVRQSSSLGGSTNVVIRGAKSIYGNNQALYVVDGVPFSNGGLNSASINQSGQRSGTGGYDYGSPANDINPDDVESVTVLKGAAATALYGSQGANGVILITTKKAKKGLGITINAGIGTGSIDKTTFAKYQKQYGGGYGNYYDDPTGYFLYQDVNGDGKPDLIDPLTEDASYGAKFDPNLLVYQWDAFYPSSPNYLKATPWVAAANDPSKFFTRATQNNESIFITNANDNGSFKLGYTRDNQTGIMPNSNILKQNVDFSGSYNVTSKLTASANISYINTVGLGRYGTGYQSDNILNSFRQWYQVNNDVYELRDQYFASGGQNTTWNLSAPFNTTPIYWDNPYFIRYQNYNSDTRNRYFGNVAANYKVTSWLNILGRATVDNWTQLQEERRQVGSVGVSGYTRRNLGFTESNYDLIASADKDLTKDLNLKAVLGGNIRKQRYQTISASTNGGLVVPGIYAVSNSVSQPVAPVEGDQQRELDGVYGELNLTYAKVINIDGTIRRDASSTLPKGANVYYYPSVAVGFIFSNLLKDYKWLSYGKLRGNYAQVGNDATPYSTIDTYSIGTPYGSSSQTYISTTKNLPNLRPERTQSTEAGLELQFFNNRLGLDATYYVTKTKDQLIPVSVSTATGFSSTYRNAGTVQNKGIELALTGTPLKTSDFSWNLGVNYTRNRNKLIETFNDATGNPANNLLLASFQGGVTLNATLGEPLGTIRGSNYVFLNGQRVVKANGRYQLSATSNEVIGNYNPDWIGGITNTFKYKNFTLSFLVDMRKGGQVFSLDMYYGLATGLYPETAGNNDLGNPSRNTLATGGGIILPGVKADGTPNTTRVSNTVYGTYGYVYNPNAAFIYDASYVKLREASLGYSFPQKWISGLGPVKGVDVSVNGHNLWIIHKNVPYADPEETLSSGNLQGYQSGAMPTVRSFILNLRVKF